MISTTFRFYAQLNDFLPRQLRHGRFPRVIPSPTSVKDAIEGIGVPHTEVDLILINGDGGDFEYQLRDGDDVAVYPAFRSIDTGSMRRAGADPPCPGRFAIDVHLGKLASLLRLAGFDAIIVDDDAELAATAEREARVVLTRDVGVLKRTVVRHGHFVRHTEPEWQFAEILERFDLVGLMAPFTRCLRCNTPVREATARDVAGRLPPRTRAAFDTFRECPACGRIYWKGSHYAHLARVIESARQRVGQKVDVR